MLRLRVLIIVLAMAPSAFAYHSADTEPDYLITLSELLRVIQFYNVEGFSCQPGTEDGFAIGPGDTGCAPHDSDYKPKDWQIGLSELLRLIQFYNFPGYNECAEPGSEDGFCAGLATEGEGEGEGVVFGDNNLEAAVRGALSIPSGPINEAALMGLTHLRAPGANIHSLDGLEHAVSLVSLDLHSNCIADLGPIGGLDTLEILNLHANAIDDVSALAGLTNLRLLWLDHNQIADPAPLLDNAGLGPLSGNLWDRVALAGNPLNAPGADAAIAALRARGAAVWAAPATASPPLCLDETPGDPVPIGITLIHGDPQVDDAHAYVMVCLGDGYTEALLDDPAHTVADVPQAGHPSGVKTWSKAIADAIHFMLTQEPFTEYAAYFKVYRVDLISNEEQLSDNRIDPPLLHDTALAMAIASLAFDYDNDLVHRIAGLAGVPVDRILLMPNAQSSGSNQDDVTMFSNARASRTMTALHELGHGIGKLTDEYEYRHGTNPPASEPPGTRAFANAVSMGTKTPTIDEIPWKHWLSAPCGDLDNHLGVDVDFDCVAASCQCELTADHLDCMPLPSCEPGGNFVVDGKIYGRTEWPEPGESTPVGLYEGAWFRTKGAYRPELRCRMRSDDDVPPGNDETPRFCKVCREALVLEFVSDAGNAAAWSPPNAAPLAYGAGETLHFSVMPHAPATPGHFIEIVEWRLDDVVQQGTANTFALDTTGLDAGSPHTLSVTLADRTPWVLANYDAGQAHLQQTIAWTLSAAK